MVVLRLTQQRCVNWAVISINRTSGTSALMSHSRHHDIQCLSRSTDRSLELRDVTEALQFCQAGQQSRSPTPYTGSSGLAYALWRAGTFQNETQWQQQARDLAAAALRRSAHVADESLLDGGCHLRIEATCNAAAGPSAAPTRKLGRSDSHTARHTTQYVSRACIAPLRMRK